MSIYDQIGAPNPTDELYGQYSLHRAHLVYSTAATPVTPLVIEGIVGFNFGAPSFDEKKLLQQGGGDNPLIKRRNFKWAGQINFNQGLLPTAIAQMRGVTWGTANDRALSFKDKYGAPLVHWEAVCRDVDNKTPLFSVVIPNMVIDPWGFDNPMESAEGVLPFHTDFPPIFLYAYTQFVWDLFDGDGSTTGFTLSNTPVDLLDSSDYDDFVLDNIAIVTVKRTTDTVAAIQKTGISYSGGQVTFTSAPAAGSLVGIGYASAVAAE